MRFMTWVFLAKFALLDVASELCLILLSFAMLGAGDFSNAEGRVSWRLLSLAVFWWGPHVLARVFAFVDSGNQTSYSTPSKIPRTTMVDWDGFWRTLDMLSQVCRICWRWCLVEMTQAFVTWVELLPLAWITRLLWCGCSSAGLLIGGASCLALS